LLELMKQARSDAFSCVIVESLDRLSRDQEDMAGLYKRLTFAGVDIRTLHEGQADEIHVGVRSIVSSLYIKDLKQKVRRGMSGVVREGRRAGGCPYGYSIVVGRPGELHIIEEQAQILRQIFHHYVSGKSPKAICNSLNKEGVPAPRGRYWVPSSLNGRRSRGDGILRNPMYVGKIAWNRTTKVKNPETGRRIQRENPKSEWQYSDASHLAIIDSGVFDKAQEMLESLAHKRLAHRRRPKHLLSGLLKCGVCGGGMSSMGADKTGKTRIICSTYHNSGSCSHSRIYYASSIITLVIKGIRENLEHPDAIKEFLREYHEERQRLNRQKALEAARVHKDLADVERKMRNIVNALAEGLTRASIVRETLLELETHKEELTKLATANVAEEQIISLHPMATKRYLELIDQLSSGKEPEVPVSSETAIAFRELVASVVVYEARVKGEIEVV